MFDLQLFLVIYVLLDFPTPPHTHPEKKKKKKKKKEKKRAACIKKPDLKDSY